MPLFFGKKKDEPQGGTDKGATTSSPTAGDVIPQEPAKARAFFDRAKTVDETGNHEYAAQLWLNGMKWDAHSMTGLEGFFGTMLAFNAESGGKKRISKEVERSVAGNSDLEKYLASLLEWGQKIQDAVLAVRAMEAGAKIGLTEPCYWIGERAFNAIARDPKPRKDLFLKLSDAFGKIGSFEKSVIAAEAAFKLDPTDGQLSAHIRSLAAQATMAKGGYDQTGQQGGFRANIRDAQKQRQLEEADRVVKTEETIDRLLAAAQKDHQDRPGDVPSIDKLAKLHLERGRGSDEERAHGLYLEAFNLSKQFRFRELAGDIRIRQARRKASDLKKMLESAPGEETVQRMLEQAETDLRTLEIAEFKLRVEQYPTDLARKFELGKRYFAAGDFENALGCLQEAQSDPRNRVSALSLLGQSFLALGYSDEAIETFRRALELSGVAPEVVMELRYGLMAALQAKASHDKDLAAGEESERIAASIFAQQIGYKDIRARRDAIKKLVAELRAAKGQA